METIVAILEITSTVIIAGIGLGVILTSISIMLYYNKTKNKKQ